MQPPVAGFWGKAKMTQGTNDVEGWHPLKDHCIDVAITFRTLSEIPGIRRALFSSAGGELSSAQLDRLAVFAVLHDLGKFNRGFQGKLRPGAPKVGHVIECLGLFGLGAVGSEALRLKELGEWFHAGLESAQAMLLAAISHHGQPLSFAKIEKEDALSRFAKWWIADDSLNPLHGVRELVCLAERAFPSAFTDGPNLDASPALQHRFAGLVMLADWIASDTKHFRYRESESEDRIVVAREYATRAFDSIGMYNDRARADIAARGPGFLEVFRRAPYPLQRVLAEDLPLSEDSRLLIAESETGSGKTEAALGWFLRLYREGAVDGLYFALPTRVAARELYGRVVSAIHSAFPTEALRLGPVLLAVPGYARTDEDSAMLPYAHGNLWPDNDRDSLHDRAWVAENPKRFLAAPVAVGTIDQALLAVLQVRHAHLRSVCLDRHLLVVDEVHASDPYMRELLRALLAHHLRIGGRALLLSATLGEFARAQFLSRPPISLAEAQSVPYPAITTRTRTIPVLRPDAREKAVRIEFVEALEDLPKLVGLLADALDAGARVLAIMNTVSRVVALLRTVEESGRIPPERVFTVAGVCCPHHGRFARADREILDTAVTTRFGQNSMAGPVLLVGSQTLEQSLDIDADLLVTDHCPMDVLLQRIGRLHRHERIRPERHAIARCIVLSPTGNNLEQFIRTKGQYRGDGFGPAGIGTVYGDLRVMKLTRDVLENSPMIAIPRDNRRLVEAAMHPDALARFDTEPWLIHEQGLSAETIAQCRLAELGTIEEQPFGEFHFQELGGRIATRLGLSDRLVKLPQSVTTPFGQSIDELGIPGHLAPKGDAVDAMDLEHESGGFRFAVDDRRYRYSRFGLELIRD